MKNATYRYALALTGLCTCLSLNLSAKEHHFERAQKELRIMSKIFETSLTEQDSGKNRLLGSKKTQATYLAKQGMVFTFNFSQNSFASANDWAVFGEGLGNFVGEIASEVGSALGQAMVAPSMPNPPDSPDIGFDFEQRLEDYEQQREALELMREKHQHQREEVRELQREIRRMERDRDNESSSNQQLAKTKAALEEKVDVLKDKMDQYKKSMKEYRAKRDKKYIEGAKHKAKTIVSTLCDYGATLRSLKGNEYITLIFKNYSNNNDQVYVFNYNNVRNCSSGEKLLKSSISYHL